MAGEMNKRSGAGKFFLGSPAETIQVDRYNPQQQSLINRSAQLAGDKLGNASFDPYAQQARQNFAQQTVPGLAERFTSMGGQGSSAFGQQLGNAASNLESNLATGQADFDQNMLRQLLGTGLTQQFDSIYQPQQAGFLENAGNSLAGGLKYLPMLAATGGFGGLGQLLSGMVGSQMGNQMGQSAQQNQNGPIQIQQQPQQQNNSQLMQLLSAIQSAGGQQFQQPQQQMQQQPQTFRAQSNPNPYLNLPSSGPFRGFNLGI